MNIVLYAHTFLPTVGGREVVMYQLGRALMARGHQVRVVGPAGYRTQSNNQFDVPTFRYPRFSLDRPLTDLRAQRLMELQMTAALACDLVWRKADVIHSHVLYPAGYVGVNVGRIMRKPTVLTPHGVDINVDINSGYGMRLDPGLNHKIERALSMADAITAISDGILKQLRDMPGGVEKITKITNGVDLSRFSPAAGAGDEHRKYFDIPDRAKLILTVGNYSELKGQADIVRAMPLVLKKAPNAVLVVVGANTEVLRDLSKQLQVEQSVLLTGSIPMPMVSSSWENVDDALGWLYRRAAVYVSASNREGAEGLSLSLLDAMAARLPIVATNITGNRDVVSDELNGRLVKPGCSMDIGAAILDILTDQELASRMGNESLSVAETFSWDAVASQYEDIYEQVTRVGSRN